MPFTDKPQLEKIGNSKEINDLLDETFTQEEKQKLETKNTNGNF